jgi:hypothetical protein
MVMKGASIMPAIRLTESNVKYLKEEIRRMFPPLGSSGASELVANILGFQTNIALRTAVREDHEGFERIVHLTDEFYEKRKTKLGFPDIDQNAIYQLTGDIDFPDPIWREMKTRLLSENTAWYNYCNARNLPLVYIQEQEGVYEVQYDAITVDPPYDHQLTGDRGDNMGMIIYNLVEAVCKLTNSKWDFDGSAFVGSAKSLTKEAALLFADGVFELHYFTTQRERLARNQAA